MHYIHSCIFSYGSSYHAFNQPFLSCFFVVAAPREVVLRVRYANAGWIIFKSGELAGQIIRVTS